jgi:hypothetical protein
MSSEDYLKNYLRISDEYFRVFVKFTPNSFLSCRWIKLSIITKNSMYAFSHKIYPFISKNISYLYECEQNVLKPPVCYTSYAPFCESTNM